MSASGDSDDKALEAVLERVREGIGRAHKPFATAGLSSDDIAAEFAPFVECVSRALAQSRDSAPSGVSWNEARSMAWLFSHRMANHGLAPAVVTAALSSWRDAVVRSDDGFRPWVERACDELFALVIEGYARGVEEREKLRAQRALADAAPVRELEPGFLLAIAAGPMDAEGAQQFAERVSRDILRRDARVVVLDVGDLEEVTAAVMAELWAIPSAARTLGARTFVGGLRGMVLEVVSSAGLAEEGEVRVALVAEAMRLAREAIAPPPEVPFWKRWLEPRSARKTK
ncbi:MAG: hypothetical protein JNK05_27810 [Myxococcales bacterium]|nr:hypothetical protein [Myxococcales bacterium]